MADRLIPMDRDRQSVARRSSSSKRRLEPTGIEGAAFVFSSAGFGCVAFGLALLYSGWRSDIDGLKFFFLGLEFAAAGVTTATVALTLGPHRGRDSRRAWVAAGAGLLLVVVAIGGLLPPLIERGIVG